jgi:hypothetical protein
VGRHLYESGAALRLRIGDLAAQAGTVAVLVVLTGYAVTLRSSQTAYALTLGLEDLQVAEVQYVVAGAGSGPVGQVRYTFNMTWNWGAL